jgi:cytochrome P450
MKESMRLHGGGVSEFPSSSICGTLEVGIDRRKTASFRRKVLKPITLSDGTCLPPGTFVNAPTHALSHDAPLFPDPDNFDGLRFFKLRQQSQADKNKHQFTTIDNVATYFGAGRHACPGRRFADVLAKMVIAALVMKYDFKMIEGDNTPRDYQVFGGLVSVNKEKKVLIRDRVEGQL